MDEVTTRRLAEFVEYSQPVLYSHFDGRDAIVRAVAIEGCRPCRPVAPGAFGGR